MSNIPRLVLAGTSSGVGKTLISCAIIHALKHSGYSVQPFKVGPDYIDTGYLSLVAKRKARNLDSWIMDKDAVIKSFVQNSTSDISIIEGVMGYYDGSTGKSTQYQNETNASFDLPQIRCKYFLYSTCVIHYR